jgi:hypothetical protein
MSMGLCPGLNHSKWVTSQNRFGSTAIGSRKASRTMSDSPACGKPVDGGGSMRRDHIRGGAEPSKPQTSLICLAAMAIGFCYTTQEKLLVLVLLVLVLLLVLFMFANCMSVVIHTTAVQLDGCMGTLTPRASIERATSTTTVDHNAN